MCHQVKVISLTNRVDGSDMLVVVYRRSLVSCRQVFDIEMSPLPFLIDKMFHFIQLRFESNDQHIQEQGLQWLQILTSIDIAIPVFVLLNMIKVNVLVSHMTSVME